MTSQDLISVILTTLNGERFVRQSIRSCLNQSHGNIELLVVDGGSQDSTLDVVAEFDDPRIRVVHQSGNEGKLPGALNLGMSLARGDYMTWTQDDAWYEREALETMVRCLERNPDVALAYCDYWEVDGRGDRVKYQRVNTPEHMLVDDVVRVCFLFRREVYETIGPQKTRYFPVHEPPWRIAIADRFRLLPVHKPLMNYIVHEDSLTGRLGSWAPLRMMTDNLYREGHMGRAAHRKRRAQIDVDEAFEAFVVHGDYRRFRKRVASGALRDPTVLLDRGLLKITLRSVLPTRESARSAMHAAWRDEQDAIQRQWIESAKASDSARACLCN